MIGVGKGDLLEEECVYISLSTPNLGFVCFKKTTF